MADKYSREELAKMDENEFKKAIREMQEKAEKKGRDKLKAQMARRERLLAALNELWDVYQASGTGNLKDYIKNDLVRIVKMSVDDGCED